MIIPPSLFFFFFFNDTATTEIYTLSLHDALPISGEARAGDGALEGAELRVPAGEHQLLQERPDGVQPVTRRPPRGFTLIEVTVGAAVALIVIGIVTATFLSQQRSMQALDLSREASSAARDAMLSMQETIGRSEEHTSELQSRLHLVCRLLLEKKKKR